MNEKGIKDRILYDSRSFLFRKQLLEVDTDKGAQFLPYAQTWTFTALVLKLEE